MRTLESRRPRILIADDMAICREPIAETLCRRGFDTICAADGMEAIKLIRQQKPDLVLLDVNMPGLDGLAVLRAVRCDPALRTIPIVMLTEKRNRDVVIEAARHGVQGYLLKSEFTLDELLARVSSCLQLERSAAEPDASSSAAAVGESSTGISRQDYPKSPEQRVSSRAERATVMAPQSPSASHVAAPPRRPIDLCPVTTKAELIRLVNEGLDLRPLGPTIQNVVAVTSRAGSSVDDVARAVGNDQALSIRVIKLANASAYSRGHLVNGVKEAIQRIGIQEVRSLVMTLGVFEQFDQFESDRIDPRLFWEHSIACGVAAAAIAKVRNSRRVDDAYLWGMIHDVGRLILLEHTPEAYASVWGITDETDMPLEAVEAKMLLLDHCDILEQALEKWRFPREFIVPVVSHHLSPARLKRLGPHTESAAIVALANRLAHALALGDSGSAMIYPLDELIEMLCITPTQIREIAAKIPTETDDLKFTILARSRQGAWPDYADILRKQVSPPLRFLNVSAEPDTDSFRLFCERLAPPTDEPPNVGIMYLRTAAELGTVTGILEVREKEANCATPLPVLILCGKGSVSPEHPLLRSRANSPLKVPVRADRLLAAAQQLIEVHSAGQAETPT